MNTHNVGMSDFNFSNPFMYLLYSTNEVLVNTTENTIKRLILLYVTGIGNILLSIIYWILWGDNQFLMILIDIWLLISPTIQIRSVVRSNQTVKINTMIYSGEFTYVNINNEEVMTYITALNVSVGKVQTLKEEILLLMIGNGLLFSIYLMGILTFIFK